MNNLIGNRYDRLLVQYKSEISDGKGNIYWHCLCDCGKEKDILSSNLTKKTTRSCGCLAKESFLSIRENGIIKSAEIRTLPSGEASCRDLYSNYKYNAKKRKLVFDISLEQFKIITKCVCYYCGIEPKFVYHRKSTNGEYTYNGIDRLDNNIGYIFNNIAPCCRICNFAKRTSTTDDFLNWIDKVYKHTHRVTNG